ncbi:MAG: DUF389 domain-containing protein [Candidatus Eremiobacteraeota bacterium]|nr:DUF389 domain-containing protein [Candidatus Eremiobacteraeota bacterium]MBC5826592.1 DUF389 domain-containing protein [Candidatus Eremiobacteraeota bacterium]
MSALRLWFKPVADADRRQLQSKLVEDARLNSNFLALVVASSVIATFGLLENSAAVIIGAMIIAPLLLPIQALAYSSLEGMPGLFKRAGLTLAVGSAVPITIAFGLGRLVGFAQFGSEVASRANPNLLDLGIAVAAGAIGGFGKVRPAISASLAGTAVAVALMPPLCVVGLGLSHSDPNTGMGALLLYITNLLGITLACMAVYLLTGFALPHKAKTAIIWTLALTVILIVPLTASLVRLIRDAQLEAALRRALLNHTTTFQHVTLVSTDLNWLTDPPVARLYVRSDQPITPHQVGLIEDFAKRSTGQRFHLVFNVSRIDEVTSETVRQAPALGSTP